jgi:hypothetical protein
MLPYASPDFITLLLIKFLQALIGAGNATYLVRDAESAVCVLERRRRKT